MRCGFLVVLVLVACESPSALVVDVQAPDLAVVDVRLALDTQDDNVLTGPKGQIQGGRFWNEEPFDVMRVPVLDGVARIEIDGAAELNNGEPKTYRFVAIGFTDANDDTTATSVGVMDDVPVGDGAYRQLELAEPAYLEAWRSGGKDAEHACAMVVTDAGTDIYTRKDDQDCDSVDPSAECDGLVYLAQSVDALHSGVSCFGVPRPGPPTETLVCSLGTAGCNEVDPTDAMCTPDDNLCATGTLCAMAEVDIPTATADGVGSPPALDCVIFPDPDGKPCEKQVQFDIPCDDAQLDIEFQPVFQGDTEQAPQAFASLLQIEDSNVAFDIEVRDNGDGTCTIGANYHGSTIDSAGEDPGSEVFALMSFARPGKRTLVIPAHFVVGADNGMDCDQQPPCGFDPGELIRLEQACNP